MKNLKSRTFAKAILAGQIISITRKGKRYAENQLEIACDCWQSQDGFWCYNNGPKDLKIGLYDWDKSDAVLK